LDDDLDTKVIEILRPHGNDNLSMQPPLLPDEVLSRVYRLARRDGFSVLMIASIFAFMAAVMGDAVGAIIGLGVAGTGAIELHGCHQLRDGEPRGMRWLIMSQFGLMTIILIYCGLRLANFHPDMIDQAITPEMRSTFLELDYTDKKLHALVRNIYYLTYSFVGIVTIIYQGAMARYYLKRRDAVAQAMIED
jgi:hypothetical protein